MWHYLKVNDDLSVSVTDEPFNDSRYAFKTVEGAIFPCETHAAIVLSDDLCSIGGFNHFIDSIKGINLDDVSGLQDYQSSENILIKDVKSKLPDPFKDKLAPFTAAVVLACLTKSKKVALASSDHQKKMTIQRQIKLLVGTGDEISVKKAIELLGYYGLNITDVLSSDLIITKK